MGKNVHQPTKNISWNKPHPKLQNAKQTHKTIPRLNISKYYKIKHGFNYFNKLLIFL